MIRLLIIISVLMFSAMAFGQANEPEVPVPQGGPNHPCVKLHAEAMAACQAAGYYKGGWKKPFPPPNQNLFMGLYKDCMAPIMKLGTIPTNVNQSALPDFGTCQTAKAGHH